MRTAGIRRSWPCRERTTPPTTMSNCASATPWCWWTANAGRSSPGPGSSRATTRWCARRGPRPSVPPVRGPDLPGVFVSRTLEDLDAIRESAGKAGRGRRAALVIGGGLLGLEAAKALRDMGLSPHLVEMGPRLMPLQVDEGGGGLLRRLVTGLDVTVHTGTSTEAIEPDGDRLFARLGN